MSNCKISSFNHVQNLISTLQFQETSKNLESILNKTELIYSPVFSKECGNLKFLIIKIYIFHGGVFFIGGKDYVKLQKFVI